MSRKNSLGSAVSGTSISSPSSSVDENNMPHDQKKVGFYDEGYLPGVTKNNSDYSLISETSSDLRVRDYARSLQRNYSRRSSLHYGSDVDEEVVFEMAMLLDKTRGLPCKCKKGKVSASNLFELNFRERKRQSLVDSISSEMTPEKAFDLLNCKWLRLTKSNVEQLEYLSACGGYDTRFHPHKEIEIENFFDNLQVNESEE